MNDIGSSDPMVQLAALMLEADELRAKTDEDELRAAQRARMQALDAEVHALHEAAHQTRVGAVVGGIAAAAGGAAAALGSGLTPVGKQPTGDAGVLLKSGEALEQLAGPLGRLLGDGPSLDAQADAKQAEQQAADAGTRRDLAQQHHDRVRSEQDRTIATTESIIESEAQGNWALIANV